MENNTDAPSATDSDWLAYADLYWSEIVDFCGLDKSFVGAYCDAAAISYAKSFYKGE